MTPPLKPSAVTSASGEAERVSGGQGAIEGGTSEPEPLLCFLIHGHPATQGSKKAFKRGKKIVLVEMDPKLPEWRAAVTKAAKDAAGPDWKPWDGPVSVRGIIRLPAPRKSKFGEWPAGPPDLDKLQRAIGDALTNSKVITDDARIVHWDIRKTWAENNTGATLTITEMSTQ